MTKVNSGIRGIFKEAGKDAIKKNRDKIDKSSPEGGCDGIDKIANNGFEVDFSSLPFDASKIDEFSKLGENLLKNIKDSKTCDSECIYNKRLIVLHNEMKQIEKSYEKIPNQLREAQKAYYSHKKNGNYIDFEKKNVDNILGNRIGYIQRKFNIYKTVLKNIDKEGDPVQKGQMVQYLKDLEVMYDKEYMNLNDKSVHDREKFKIADRNNIHHQHGINSFKKYNFIIFIFILISTMIYFMIFLYVYQEYKSLNLIFRRIGILGPLLLLYAFVLGVYIYISEESFIPSFRPFESSTVNSNIESKKK